MELTAGLLAGMLLAHMLGDYVIQNHWMATQKTSKWFPAIAHGVTYTVPFFFLATQSWLALFVICSTHIVIDRYRLAKYVVWFKNQFAPKKFRPAVTATGYADDVPAFLSVWLMIILDNLIHLAINYFAILRL